MLKVKSRLFLWWRGEDLNLRRQRQQIYSLSPLTTQEPLPKGVTSNGEKAYLYTSI